jgi:non-specific protein-tyrosine kinase
MLLAVCFEHFDTRIRTPEALSQLLSWPILATISLANPGKGDAVVNPQGQSANAEAYRILRTNVGFSEVNRPVRSIIVTSALSGEGKSTVAANLAIFMAKAGKDTLLIDANLRHPSLYQQFGLSTERMGLSNAIMSFSRRQFSSPPQVGSPSSSGASLDPYMHLVGIPNLRIMPSGPLPPNPPELLDSKAMGRFFLAIARCRAEIIIIDTPPLLGLSDTSILASKVEATLFPSRRPLQCLQCHGKCSQGRPGST